MDAEFQLTLRYVGLGLASFVFVAALAWFMQWTDRISAKRSLFACAWLFVSGLLVIVAALFEMPADISTPFGQLNLLWLGVILVVSSVGARAFARRHRG